MSPIASTLVVLCFSLGAVGARAQGMPPGPPPGAPSERGARREPPPFFGKLYPPEMIESFQDQLEITKTQREKIMNEILSTQKLLLESRWNDSSVMAELLKTLDAAVIDETKALALHEKLLESENKIKRANISLLIRLKGILSVAQRAQLDKIKKDGGPKDPR